MINFRKANIEDADILAMIRSIFLMEANDFSSETERKTMEIANKIYFEKALGDGSFLAWLALDDSKVVATSGLSFITAPPNFKRPDGREAHIMNMFTFSDYRKQGIGSELLKRTIAEAKMRGYKKITLNATDMGKSLYEKYGFNDVIGSMVLYIE